MQFTAQELKDKLLRALDADNNVVDLGGALEVISTLEKYPVTKAELEQTRLGKHVNDMRKTTSNKDLAKRAKNLVRKWRDFISPSNAGPGAAINGAGPPGVSGGRGEANNLLAHTAPHLLKGVLGSKPASPASGPSTPSSVKSNVSPPSLHYAASTSGSSRPGTPLSSLHSRLSPRLGSHAKPASPLVSPGGHNNNRHSHNITGRPADRADLAGNNITGCEIIRPSTPSETVSKVNVANKRKRRGPALEEAAIKVSKYPMLNDSSDGSHKLNNNGESLNAKPSDHMVNGGLAVEHYKSVSSRTNTSQECDGESVHTGRQVSPVNRSQLTGAQTKCQTPLQQSSLSERRSANLNSGSDLLAKLDCTPSSADQGAFDRSCSNTRTPKVKTTAQLIQELHNTVGMRLSGSETVNRIARNQIEKEPDIVSESVVPAGAKPRFRRKPGSSPLLTPPPSSEKSLSKTKTEMVQKFLRSSVPEDDSPIPDTPTATEQNLINLIKQDEVRVETLALTKPAPSNSPVKSRPKFTVPLPNKPGGVEAAPKEEVDPWSLLPPLDLDAVSLEEEPYEVPGPRPVGEGDVETLQTEHWPGVNGQLDHECNWQNWTATYSTPSADNNLLHLLPYVSLDND